MSGTRNSGTRQSFAARLRHWETGCRTQGSCLHHQPGRSRRTPRGRTRRRFGAVSRPCRRPIRTRGASPSRRSPPYPRRRAAPRVAARLIRAAGSGRPRAGLHRSLLAWPSWDGPDDHRWVQSARGLVWRTVGIPVHAPARGPSLRALSGAPVAFVSVGAGPLNSRLSRWMCVRALRLATFVSFRDAESLGLMRRLGYQGEGTVRPDLAFGLALEDPRRVRPGSLYGSPSMCSRTRTPSTIHTPWTAVRVLPRTSMGSPGWSPPPASADSSRCCSECSGRTNGFWTSSRSGCALVHRTLGEVERRMPTTVPDVIALIDGCDARDCDALSRNPARHPAWTAHGRYLLPVEVPTRSRDGRTHGLRRRTGGRT